MYFRDIASVWICSLKKVRRWETFLLWCCSKSNACCLCNILQTAIYRHVVPWVLWHCCFDSRKVIWPVKKRPFCWWSWFFSGALHVFQFLLALLPLLLSLAVAKSRMVYPGFSGNQQLKQVFCHMSHRVFWELCFLCQNIPSLLHCCIFSGNCQSSLLYFMRMISLSAIKIVFLNTSVLYSLLSEKHM